MGLGLGSMGLGLTAQRAVGWVDAYAANQAAVIYEPSSDSTTVGLPLQFTGTLNIDWGDGTVEDVTGSGWKEHSYATAGEYTAVFTGTISKIWHSVTETGQLDHLTRVLSFPQAIDQLWLRGASKLIEVPPVLPSTVTTLNEAFKECVLFNDSNIVGWNVSAVTDMTETFKGATVFNQPIGNWDTSSCTNMQRMFGEAVAFNQDLNWNTSSVLDMADMFRDATAFNGDISGFDTSALIGLKMQNMFLGASAFNRDISGWNVSGITSFSNVFNGASAFNQPLAAWDTSAATNMLSMFSGASAFNQPLAAWDTSSVTNMGSMFLTATAFNQDISTWNVLLIASEPANFATSSALLPSYKPQWGTDGTGTVPAQDLGALSTWAATNGTVSGDTLTADAGTGDIAVTARKAVSIPAPGSYTFIMDVDATANLSPENQVSVKFFAMDTVAGLIFCFDVGGGTVVRDNGFVCRMTAKTGGLYTCEIDFAVTSDGAGLVDIGPNETTALTVFRLTNPAGNESITVSNIRIEYA